MTNERTNPRQDGRPPGVPPAARAPMALPEVAPLAPPAGFEEEARALGIEFERGDLDRLGLYLALLLEINKSTNLTAIEDAALAWRRHILDSLTLVGALSELPKGSRVIDVGSGGGLPGVPLAICMPDLSFALLEATGKKVEFLSLVVRRLGLSNAVVVPERAERAGHDRGEKVSRGPVTTRQGGHREAYDAVVARAVGRLPTLLELTAPFAKVGGKILLIKGEQAGAEVDEAREAMHLLKVVHVGTLDTPTGRIVVLEKPSATPRTYPRADGEPKRSPLGVGRSRPGR